MATAIVSDSSVSLPADITRGLPLFLAPLEVRIDGRVYDDGVDIVPAEFYARLKSSARPPLHPQAPSWTPSVGRARPRTRLSA